MGCLISLSVLAAKPSGLGKPTAAPEVYKLKSPIQQAQELLKQQDLYGGEIDGIKTPALVEAIKKYQLQHGLKQTGRITASLLEHMENIGRVRALISRLDIVRKDRQAKARQALLANPATRKLIEEKENKVADPTRDASRCFESPSSDCLLKEAVESSRAVFEDDLRDWALGEILSAQVSTGLSDAAMETAARIKDSRLVIAALTNIAKAQAKEGNISEALSGLSLIPVAQRRLSVLLDIAAIHEDAGEREQQVQIINKILAGVFAVERLEDRLSIQIQAAETLSSADKERSLRLLEEITTTIKAQVKDRSQTTLLRQSASAMAKIGYPEWSLKALADLPDDETRIPVLMAATRAFLKEKRFQAARRTIQRISAPRYRSVILTDLAHKLWEDQKNDPAMKTLAEAQTLANSINLPFAKNYALSKITETLITIAGQSKDSLKAEQAYRILDKIKDDRLKAKGLWHLSTMSLQHGLVVQKTDLEKETDKAMGAIKSQFSKAWILGDLADLHYSSGQTKQAEKAFKLGLQTAKDIKNPWARSRALAKFGAVIHRLD